MSTDPTSDDVLATARRRLAGWLAEQAAGPEYSVTEQDLADWDAERVDEFVVLTPPGYANQVFLVGDESVDSYAPSRTSFDDALAAARAHS
ncbi:hypothetical protein [Kribbella sp.]|uniref:hypothetical protein n=1 Tax=Kribbella sp. TaxID=1871183 RepID=UPI002D26FDE9|nr:hypothetical protein [Kribbella sp.]HZX03894.1 hypothetical protein [Kribbella sp.]